MKIYSYYDGHYPEPNLTLEEIEEIIKKRKKLSDELTEWSEVE